MGEFRLTPQEDYVFGVSLKGDRLVFGPSGGELARVALLVLFSGFLAVAFAASRRGALAWLVPAAIAAGVLGHVGVTLRSRVVATPEHLAVRGPGRTRIVSWPAIERIVVDDLERGVTFGRRSELKAVALLELRDHRRVRLPGFVSAATADPMSLGAVSATRIKVDALLRYRAEVAPR